jgi:hypothetical protein
MSDPGEKSSAIKAMLDDLAIGMTGKPRTTGLCAVCGGEAVEFKDELSRREYKISFMCQKCQDEVFEGGNDD